MKKLRLVIPLSTLMLLAYGPVGCGEKEDDTGDDGGTAGDDGGDAGDAGDAGDGTGGGGSGATGTGTTTAPPEPKENGEECATNEECKSGMCYVTALGGSCGECLVDEDCPDGGCSIPNPIAGTGSECNNGELGEGCMSDEVCETSLCAEIITVGDLVISGCSECKVDDECSDGKLCSPIVSVTEFTGHRTCVDPGSLDDGEACDFETSGDDACMNLCGVAEIPGVAEIGVCGECKADDANTGCADGETCQAAQIDLNNGALVPAECVAE